MSPGDAQIISKMNPDDIQNDSQNDLQMIPKMTQDDPKMIAKG